MESWEEPLALRYARKSIKVYLLTFHWFLGKALLEWDINTLQLEYTTTNTNPRDLRRWVCRQLFYNGLYGTIGGFWYILFSPAKLERRVLIVVITSYGITTLGIAHSIFRNAKAIKCGYNALLDYQSRIIRAYANQWTQIEGGMRSKIRLIGKGLYFGTFVWAYTGVNTVVAVYFNFDLGYEFLGNEALRHTTVYGFRVWPACILLRALTCLFFLVGISESTCFMFLYLFQTIQAYVGVLSTILKIEEPMVMVQRYQTLLTLHAYTTPFLNTVNGLLMFFGHSASLGYLWGGIRGWEQFTLILILFLLAGGFIIIGWLFLQLTVLSRVQSTSVSLKTLLLNELQFVKGGIKRKELGLRTRCIFPTQFYSGSSFVIGEDSPGCYLMTIVDNLTSALLTF